MTQGGVFALVALMQLTMGMVNLFKSQLTTRFTYNGFNLLHNMTMELTLP